MKNILSLLLIGAAFQSCTPKEDYKAVRTEVLSAHDKVMMDSETAFKDKKALDGLDLKLDNIKKVNPALDIPKEKLNILAYKNKLDSAEAQTDNWMHQFDAELGKKTDDEALTYFKSEKKKVLSLDSLYKKTLKETGEYLSKYK